MPHALLTREDLRRHSRLAWFGMAALAGVALWFWLLGRGGAALGAAGGWAGCLALILPPRERMPALPRRLRTLPRICDAAPVFATVLSAPGYGLEWFYGDNLYDEAVHALNGIAAGLVFAALLLADGQRRALARMARAGFLFGLALSLGWEAFEWATGLIGSVTDTVSDIVLTTLGAMLGTVPATLRGQVPVAEPSWTAHDGTGRGA